MMIFNLCTTKFQILYLPLLAAYTCTILYLSTVHQLIFLKAGKKKKEQSSKDEKRPKLSGDRKCSVSSCRNLVYDLELVGSKGFVEMYICVQGLLVAGLSRAPTMPATKYRICNRTTNRRLDLPLPHKGVIVMRVFLNSSTSSYHVVSLYNDKEDKVKFQLLDLGVQSNDPCPNEDLSWSTLNIPEDDVASRLQEYDCRSCVLEEGILFIPALRKVVSSNPMIVCVDLLQQACTTLNAPPESLRFENRKVNFQLWRGKPALSLVSEEKLNVWIVEDYKKQKWADPILISLPSLNENPLLKKQIPHIHQGDEEDFLVYNKYFHTRIIIGYYFCKIGSEVLSYDPTPLPTRVPATLVSVKGMRPMNSKKR